MFAATPMLLGQYRPLNSFLHRLDARSKLGPILLVLVLGLMTDSIGFYLILIAALIAGLLWSGIDLVTLRTSFQPMFWLIAVTFSYHVIFSGQEGPALVDLRLFTITLEGLQRAAFFSARLMLFVSVVFLVTLTNSASELAEAVTAILRPLEKLRLPVSDFGLILFIALRFIPILYVEFSAIKNAQIIRGVNFSGSMLSRMQSTAAIVVPVLVAAIGRADDLACAMEARGFQSGRPRTFYARSKFDRQAWLFMVGCSTAVLLIFYWVG